MHIALGIADSENQAGRARLPPLRLTRVALRRPKIGIKEDLDPWGGTSFGIRCIRAFDDAFKTVSQQRRQFGWRFLDAVSHARIRTINP